MRIKVTSDSTCDLSRELLDGYDISVIPLTIVKNGESYKDGVDILPADIFAHAEGGGDICKTAAINVEEYRAFFEPLLNSCDAVIHVCLGSGFSSCFQNACAAAEDMGNVFVIDSMNLSTGHGHVVMEACALAKDCNSIADVGKACETLNDIAGRVEASFLLDRLDYMAKGGRCSSVTALGANLLKLKPCIEVVGGKMRVGKKYRGLYEKCLSSYVKDRLADREDIIRDRLFITHTPVNQAQMDSVNAAVDRHGGFSQVYDTDAGGTVSCHCGPGTLGVLFIRKA